MRNLVGLPGTPIDNLNMEQVLTRLEQFISERRFHQVATANTDFITNALSDPELSRILQTADLVTPDGMPVVWASRLLGAPLPERVTGADLVPLLARRAALHGWRLYLLGARPEVARQARLRLEANSPGIQIVGCQSPPIVPLEEIDSEPVLADIARARPDILLVAFGSPKQEKWIARNRERLSHVSVCMGVGGTFDFLASEERRAPVWMQRRGLEWLFRLMQDPMRLWRRYTRDFRQFGSTLFLQASAMRRCRPTGQFELMTDRLTHCTVLTLHGDLNAASLPRFEAAAEAAFAAGSSLILDLHALASLDGAALGALLNLPKRANHKRCSITLVAPPPRTASLMRRTRLFDSLYSPDISLAAAISAQENTHQSPTWNRTVE